MPAPERVLVILPVWAGSMPASSVEKLGFDATDITIIRKATPSTREPPSITQPLGDIFLTISPKLGMR